MVIFSAVIALQSNHPKKKVVQFFFLYSHKRGSPDGLRRLKFFNVRLCIAYRIRQRKLKYNSCKNCAS